MNLQLAGRSVLITGASKGIGLSIAQWFAREGCVLHLVARSNDLLLQLAQQLRDGNGVTVHTYAVDLSIDAERSALMRDCPEVDILINNAGDIPAGSIDNIDDASWRAGWPAPAPARARRGGAAPARPSTGRRGARCRAPSGGRVTSRPAR